VNILQTIGGVQTNISSTFTQLG